MNSVKLQDIKSTQESAVFLYNNNEPPSGDHFAMYKNIKSLWCTPEINILL